MTVGGQTTGEEDDPERSRSLPARLLQSKNDRFHLPGRRKHHIPPNNLDIREHRVPQMCLSCICRKTKHNDLWFGLRERHLLSGFGQAEKNARNHKLYLNPRVSLEGPLQAAFRFFFELNQTVNKSAACFFMLQTCQDANCWAKVPQTSAVSCQLRVSGNQNQPNANFKPSGTREQNV